MVSDINETPRGPGRPRKEVSESGEAVPVSLRRKRGAAGMLRLKLDAEKRPGYVRRWVDNTPSRILAMQDLGYAMASQKAGDGASRTDGMGTGISRHAGKRENGEPQQMVLMECREEDYAAGVSEKEEMLKPFEEALRAGRDTTGRLGDAYEPRDGRSSISHKG